MRVVDRLVDLTRAGDDGAAVLCAERLEVVAFLVRRPQKPVVAGLCRLARRILLRLGATHGQTPVPEPVVAVVSLAVFVRRHVLLRARGCPGGILGPLVFVLGAPCRKPRVDVVEPGRLHLIHGVERDDVFGVQRADGRGGFGLDERHARGVLALDVSACLVRPGSGQPPGLRDPTGDRSFLHFHRALHVGLHRLGQPAQAARHLIAREGNAARNLRHRADHERAHLLDRRFSRGRVLRSRGCRLERDFLTEALRARFDRAQPSHRRFVVGDGRHPLAFRGRDGALHAGVRSCGTLGLGRAPAPATPVSGRRSRSSAARPAASRFSGHGRCARGDFRWRCGAFTTAGVGQRGRGPLAALGDRCFRGTDVGPVFPRVEGDACFGARLAGRRIGCGFLRIVGRRLGFDVVAGRAEPAPFCLLGRRGGAFATAFRGPAFRDAFGRRFALGTTLSSLDGGCLVTRFGYCFALRLARRCFGRGFFFRGHRGDVGRHRRRLEPARRSRRDLPLHRGIVRPALFRLCRAPGPVT